MAWVISIVCCITGFIAGWMASNFFESLMWDEGKRRPVADPDDYYPDPNPPDGFDDFPGSDALR